MLKLEVPSSGIKLNTNSKFCDLKLSFPPNAITILAGPNGGGKTTLLRAILSPRDAGISLFCEQEQLHTASPLKRSNFISYVGTTSGPRARLNVTDFLAFSFYKRSELNFESKIEAMLSELDISYLIKSKIDELSEGEYKRICIANGLLQEAKWYLLDEPEEHLDPGALKNLVRTILNMKGEGKSFILACHNLSFASYLADYFIGISSCAEIVFNECRSKVIEAMLLDELFACDFLYGTSGDGASDRDRYLLGPRYE